VLRLVGFIALLYIVGLVVFSAKIIAIENTTPTNYDAIIVLTGDSGRINAGHKLLAKTVAPWLYISGVGGGEITPSNNVTYGREATDTYGNATEIAGWVKSDGLKNILLVTSNYHIYRSIAVISDASPQLKITPYVIESRTLKDPSFYWLLFSEYNKFLFVTVENYF